ncbi:MAG: helix-turn-helix domain-containing protein [Chloroflexi bacterium]|nr:helix-turn-helix domain-containing protein [Chloroflexota bacterium]
MAKIVFPKKPENWVLYFNYGASGRGEGRMKLGAKIKQLREARKWTQQDLARNSSLTRSHISHIENNQITNPGAEAIVRLAKALEVDEDVLFEAAGIKSPRLSNDPIGSAIQDPELKKWITAENINSLPVILQRSIAATIRDYMERRQVSSEAIDQAIKTAKEQADEALLKAAANPEANPDYIKEDIRFKVDTAEETLNVIKRLKADAFAVATGMPLQQGKIRFCFFWPQSEPSFKEAYRKLVSFFRKGSNTLWEAEALINWMYSMPDTTANGNTMNPTDQNVIRMDLIYTRGDGEKGRIGFWFDGKNQFELLKTMYQSEAVVFLPEPFRYNMDLSGIPPITLNKVTLDTLGKYLASLARHYKLNEPGLIAKYPPDPPKKVVPPEEMDSDEGPEKNIQAQANFVKA